MLRIPRKDRRSAALLLRSIALALIGASPYAAAQTAVNFVGPAGPPAVPTTWNANANWNPAFVPEASLNEFAVINGGRSAFVNDTPVSPGGVDLDIGTLEIRSGGTLNIVAGSVPAVPGNLFVGFAGRSELFVRRGGTITATGQLFANGSDQAQIVVGETGGAGTATLSFAGGNINRGLRVVGPNAAISSSSNVAFGGTAIYSPVITGTTHSTIQVTGTADLSGTVRPEFNGYTPVLGNSWPLVNATTLSGNFAVNKSLVPTPAFATDYIITKSPTTATLRYTNLLVLDVDRGTGAVAIRNAVGGPIDLDAYSISSAGGALSGPWNSLQDQALTGWDEADNSGNTRRTEFKSSGVTSLTAGSSLSLGNVFTPAAPASFGVEASSDLTFQYANPTLGTVNGVINVTGRSNNLVLTINPATGEAAIQNESPFFNVTLDAYTITSASGKLLTGDSAWNSLQDQGLSGWDQADNANVNRLTEFKTAGATSLSGGGTVLDLGAPVNIAGGISLSDFGFTYALGTGQVGTGVVKFGPLPTGTTANGDYDDDGDVDGTDFLRWQRTLGAAAAPPGSGADGNSNGTVDAGDLTVWKNTFGASATPAVGAVPEPAGAFIALVGLLAVSGVRGGRCTPAKGVR